MAVDTFKEIPEGLKAIWGYFGDESLTSEERSQLLRIAQNLSTETTPFGPRGSRNSWVEQLYTVTATTTISATSTETIMVPDFTLPANYLVAGRCLRYTLIGDMSSAVTTPGTWTQRLRYGGVGGTIVGVGTAFAPEAATVGTTVPFTVEWWLTVRADGASGSVWVQGRQLITDWERATIATLAAQLNATMMPASAPAAVTINTTTSNAISPTSAASLTTGSLRTNLAFLEALN